MQVQHVIKKANGMLAIIAKGLEYKGREMLLRLCRVLVRPHLEYCVQFWSPYLRKDVVALETVQRKFTRMIPGIKGLTYEERLNSLDSYSPEFRRMRADLIEVYKILKGIDKVNADQMFPLMGQ